MSFYREAIKGCQLDAMNRLSKLLKHPSSCLSSSSTTTPTTKMMKCWAALLLALGVIPVDRRPDNTGECRH